MNLIRKPLVAILLGFATLVLFTTCQQMPLEPTDQSQAMAVQGYRPAPLNPEIVGLAKTVGSDTEYIHKEFGGIVGGKDTGDNFVLIPPNTLTKDGYIYLAIDVVDDPADPLYGALVFDVSTSTNENSMVKEHIDLQDGTTCQLYVKKNWFSTPPTSVLTTDGDEVVTNITEYEGYWMIEVTHFSVWAWTW